MRNKYLYRIYRLRRIIVLSTFTGVGLFFIAWLTAEQRYHSVLEQNDVLLWSLGFFAATNIIQMMFFPRAVAEIFRISCSIGIAMVFIAIISNALATDIDAFTSKAKFGMIFTFIIFFLLTFIYTSKHYAILYKFNDGKPILVKQDVWINTTSEKFYDSNHMQETDSPWSLHLEKIEKVEGYPSRFLVFNKSHIWDAEEALVKSSSIQITVDVVSTEKNVSESVVMFDEEGNLATTYSYVIIPKESGIIYSSIEETGPRPVFERFSFLILDRRGDHFYHIKESFERSERISIISMEHQPYLTEWVAYQLNKLKDQDNFDIDN